jgi:hypothetical protein
MFWHFFRHVFWHAFKTVHCKARHSDWLKIPKALFPVASQKITCINITWSFFQWSPPWHNSDIVSHTIWHSIWHSIWHLLRHSF